MSAGARPGVRPAIAVTAGEPAGIGPELCAMLAARHAVHPYDARLVLLGDRDLLVARAARIGIALRHVAYEPLAPHPERNAVEIWDMPLGAPVRPGHPDPAHAPGVIAMLGLACDGCLSSAFGAMVTAPVQKSAIFDAGIPFSGHTEFLAERTGTRRVVMLLVGGDADRPLRVALVTTHLPLKDVAAAVTAEAVLETLVILARDLDSRFHLPDARLAVCGLNPHAGEGGHLGREEIDAIAPAIAAARRLGLDVDGPLPADTVFVPQHARAYDAIVAMYHDQGLPVLKAASFGRGVNVTLGLPFVRTSVDHGTALDLAVDPVKAKSADGGSLHAALELAIALARA